MRNWSSFGWLGALVACAEEAFRYLKKSYVKRLSASFEFCTGNCIQHRLVKRRTTKDTVRKSFKKSVDLQDTVVFFSFIYHFWVDLEPSPEPSTGTACETGN